MVAEKFGHSLALTNEHKDEQWEEADVSYEENRELGLIVWDPVFHRERLWHTAPSRQAVPQVHDLIRHLAVKSCPSAALDFTHCGPT